jgi:hypothetical protein
MVCGEGFAVKKAKGIDGKSRNDWQPTPSGKILPIKKRQENWSGR